MTIFVPGVLMNLKSNRAHWSSAIAYKRVWRQKVKLAFRWDAATMIAAQPKRVVFDARVWNLFDEQDGLRAALSPVLDGLRDAGVIHSDAPDCGHRFEYAQRVDRLARGVAIYVEKLP